MHDKENTSILGDLLILLTIIMAILKLAGVISISWWLVFLPVLIEVGFAILVLLIAFIVIAFWKMKGQNK